MIKAHFEDEKKQCKGEYTLDEINSSQNANTICEKIANSKQKTITPREIQAIAQLISLMTPQDKGKVFEYSSPGDHNVLNKYFNKIKDKIIHGKVNDKDKITTYAKAIRKAHEKGLKEQGKLSDLEQKETGCCGGNGCFGNCVQHDVGEELEEAPQPVEQEIESAEPSGGETEQGCCSCFGRAKQAKEERQLDSDAEKLKQGHK